MKAGQEKSSLLGSTFLIAAITGSSRIFGLVREQVKAYILGTSLAADAFNTAFLIPNLLRRLVGEGAMTAAFVPVFTDYIKGKSKKEVWDFAASFFVVMSFILVGIAVVGVLTAPLYVRYGFAVGYGSTPGKIELTIFLTRLMFPYILFIGLAALAQAILNSFRSFAVPASTPILLNLSIISCAFAFRNSFQTPATAFAVGVLFGGLAQLLIQLPFVFRLGLSLKAGIDIRHPGIKKVLGLMVPGLFGVGIYQINVFISQALASLQSQGAVSSLVYSSRILELILGVFVVSLATVILPRLSRQATDGDRDGMAATGLFALRMVAFVTIPATVGTILLRAPIVDLLFRLKGGSFNVHSSGMVQAALIAHMTGLFFIGAVRIVVPLFFALKDTKTPVVAAALGMLANIALCLLLPRWMGHAGIAAANSVSAMVQFILLAYLVGGKLPSIDISSLSRPLVRMMFCSMIMALSCVFSARHFIPPYEQGKAAVFIGICVVVVISSLVYGLLSAATSSPELGELLKLAKRRD